MTAHAFRICALAERLLGDALEPLVVSLAMLHDVVEDGSRRVTGYDHSLKKIMFRFGGPIAAMVSELTDETSPRAGLSSAAQGAYKARRTLNHPHLISNFSTLWCRWKRAFAIPNYLPVGGVIAVRVFSGRKTCEVK